MGRVEHENWVGDEGDGEFQNVEWERQIEAGFPDMVAEAADSHGVPTPDQWTDAVPIIDTTLGPGAVWGFEVRDEDGEWHWVHALDLEDWSSIWDYVESVYPDVEIGEVEYEGAALR